MVAKIGMEKLKRLKELCPCLVGSKLEGASLFLRYPPRHSYSIKHIDAIAATMLKLAEENEKMRTGMGNISFEPDSNPESKPCRECQEHRQIARSFLPQDDSIETVTPATGGKE